MALAYPKVKEEADALIGLSNEMSSLLARVNQVLEHNSDLAINWSGGAAYIQEDGDGNLVGYGFTRAEVSNVIGSFDQFRKLMTNQAATTGDHLGNVNKLARPLG